MPLGRKAADAAYARGVVERRQADLRLESLQLRVAADVTRLAQAVRIAEEVVEAATAARQLAEQRLLAETAVETLVCPRRSWFCKRKAI